MYQKMPSREKWPEIAFIALLAQFTKNFIRNTGIETLTGMHDPDPIFLLHPRLLPHGPQRHLIACHFHFQRIARLQPQVLPYGFRDDNPARVIDGKTHNGKIAWRMV